MELYLILDRALTAAEVRGRGSKGRGGLKKKKKKKYVCRVFFFFLTALRPFLTGSTYVLARTPLMHRADAASGRVFIVSLD